MLFGFLPVFLTLYVLGPRCTRNVIALLISLLFYAWGAPAFAYVLVGGTAVDYWLSHAIARSTDQRRRKLLLTISIVANTGVLLWFKYANFFVGQVNGMLAELSIEGVGWTEVALPIGISFFTFQKISYVVDVYRGTAAPARSLIDCLLYVSLFPQLIAGPIVRYHDVARQIRERTLGSARFWSGVQRFTVGLAKKVLIANSMAAICDSVYGVSVSGVPTTYAWIAALAYYFQIYFDFSGYSDMAIGLGRMLGFEFLENFDRPYIARSFTDFWRRWHISLSNWMREYLYIPLGGNRVSRWKAYRNLWIVFLVSGFWHGASWNFVVWGAYQGAFLTVERLGFGRVIDRLPDLIVRPMMVLLVTISWVLFRGDDLGHSMAMLGRMFGGGGPDPLDTAVGGDIDLGTQAMAMLAIAAAISWLPWSRTYRALEMRFLGWSKSSISGGLVANALVWLLLVVALLGVVNSAYNPFIYFRF